DAKRDDIPARFAKLDKPHENFLACAEELAPHRVSVEIEQLAHAMRKIDPAYAPVDYYLSLTRVWGDKVPEALPLFQAALRKERDAARRPGYVEGFLQAMVKAGKPLEAYHAAPVPREAFRIVAGELKKTYQRDKLKELMTVHGKKHPDDSLLPFYQGEIHLDE